MKSIQFLVFIFFLISVKPFTPNPVPYSVYYSAESLITYFQNDYEYWTEHSVFFQFDSYLSKNEIENILSIMNDIYEKYHYYGVFLVFDDKVGIIDISYYASNVAWYLHYYMGYDRDRSYIIIIEYTVGDYGSQWENKILIQGVISDDTITNLINEYSPSLQNYNYYNVLKFIIGIKNNNDYYIYYNNNEGREYYEEYSKVKTYFTIIIILCCAAFIAFDFCKNKKKKNICDLIKL